MKVKIIIILVLGVCLWGAIRQVSSPENAMARLTAVPGRIPCNSEGGMRNVPFGADLERQCEPGRTTVFVVSQSTCSDCRTLESYLNQFLVLRPDVAVRFICLGDSWTPSRLAEQGVHVRRVPHVLIYDGQGDRIAADDGQDKTGLDLLWQWMSMEIRKHSVRSEGVGKRSVWSEGVRRRSVRSGGG